VAIVTYLQVSKEYGLAQKYDGKPCRKELVYWF
jgi:hypothetical protein